MNIKFVTSHLDTVHGGGSNVSLNLISQHLAKNGHEVSIITLEPGRNNVQQTDGYNVLEIESEQPITRFGSNERTRDALYHYAEDTDIFHIFKPSLLLGGCLFAKNSDDTHVICRLNQYSAFCTNTDQISNGCYINCSMAHKFAHDSSPGAKKLLKLPSYFSRSFIEPRYYSYIDRYIAISPSVKEIYEHNGVQGNNIDIIPNFYDPNFPTATRDSYDTNNDLLTLLYVGKLKKKKGVDLLIRAIDFLPETELYIIGDGREKDRLLNLINELGLSDQIRFTGWVGQRELPLYYRGADLFVHPGRWPEPFGRTILESLQCGTPVATSNTGAPPWITGKAGIKFKPGQVDSIVNSIEKVQTDPDVLESLSQYCEDRVEQFKPDRVISHLEEIYIEVSEE